MNKLLAALICLMSQTTFAGPDVIEAAADAVMRDYVSVSVVDDTRYSRALQLNQPLYLFELNPQHSIGMEAIGARTYEIRLVQMAPSRTVDSNKVEKQFRKLVLDFITTNNRLIQRLGSHSVLNWSFASNRSTNVVRFNLTEGHEVQTLANLLRYLRAKIPK